MHRNWILIREKRIQKTPKVIQKQREKRKKAVWKDLNSCCIVFHPSSNEFERQNNDMHFKSYLEVDKVPA